MEEELEFELELESELELEVELEVAGANWTTPCKDTLWIVARAATNRNLVQGWSQAQLVPSNCGSMCTLTNEDIIAFKCITTEAMNTKQCLHLRLRGSLAMGSSGTDVMSVGRPIYVRRESTWLYTLCMSSALEPQALGSK